MLDLEVATRPTTGPTTSPLSGGATSAARAPQPALSGRVLGVTTLPSDRPIMIMSGVAVAIVLLAGVVASFLSASSRGQADKLTSEVTALGQQLRTGPLATKRARAQTVAQQLSALSGFLRDAIAWPKLLDALAAQVPTGTKLTSITVEGEQTVRIEGETGSQQDVSTLMAALDASASFEAPRLDSLSLNESVDGSVVLFSLFTRVTPQSAVPTPSGIESAGPDATSDAPTVESVDPDAAEATP